MLHGMLVEQHYTRHSSSPPERRSPTIRQETLRAIRVETHFGQIKGAPRGVIVFLDLRRERGFGAIEHEFVFVVKGKCLVDVRFDLEGVEQRCGTGYGAMAMQELWRASDVFFA
jgi:hypothetical protein